MHSATQQPKPLRRRDGGSRVQALPGLHHALFYLNKVCVRPDAGPVTVLLGPKATAEPPFSTLTETGLLSSTTRVRFTTLPAPLAWTARLLFDTTMVSTRWAMLAVPLTL